MVAKCADFCEPAHAHSRRCQEGSCTSVHIRFPQDCARPYLRSQYDLANCRQYSTLAIHSNDNDLWKTWVLLSRIGFSRMPSLRICDRICAPVAKRLARVQESPLDDPTTNASRRLPDPTRTARGRSDFGAALGGARSRRSVAGLLGGGQLSAPLHSPGRDGRVVCRR